MIDRKQIRNALAEHTNECVCLKSDLTEGEQLYLRKIGLSKHAVELYSMLHTLGPLTAKGAAEHRPRFASAQYRLFYELERHQLVRRLSGRPRRFEALPLQLGLRSSLVSTERQFQALLSSSLKAESDAAAASGNAIQIIQGRQAVYDTYQRLAADARDEVCIYAIGIAYSPALEQTQAVLRRRGVRIRHAVQQYKLSNLHVIERWQRLGMLVRHAPAPRGFHVFVIDRQWACVTFSDPHNTDERLSLLTDNSAAVAMFQLQFNTIWNQAKDITPTTVRSDQ